MPPSPARSIRKTASHGSGVKQDDDNAKTQETLVAPVSRFNIMLGRTLGGATVATIQGVIVFVIAILAGFRPVSFLAALLSILVMLLIALLFTALGTAIASLLEDFQGFQLIVNFLIMPLFFMSGSLFPLQGLPTFIVNIAKLDFLTYGVDAMRGLLTNTSHFGLSLDISVLVVVTFVIISIGSYLFSKVQI
jgi:ABC-2 type transport system permease protein